MKIVKYFFLLVVMAAICALGYYYWQQPSQTQLDLNPRSPLSKEVTPIMLISPVAVEPPSESQKGTLSEVQGDVLHYPRVAKDWQQARNGEVINQGETIWTKEIGSATVTYPNFATINLKSGSELGIVRTLQNTFLVNQASGSATFAKQDPQRVLAIRISNTLIELLAGTVETDINQETGIITLTQTEGNSKFGIVDQDNETQIYTLKANQVATINDGDQSVDIQ